jgi:probable F420-dependent oxidoreductase
MRLGCATVADLGVTFAGFSPLGPQRAVDVAVRAQELGYRSYWTAEASGPESFAVLAACGAAAPALDLGTGIVPIQVRSPMLTAMGAATLQALHPDRRVLLGLGISSPVITARWHGVPYGERPVARMREYLGLLRDLLAGHDVRHDGAFYQLSGAQLAVRLGDRRPELVLAALNPAMLRLAGEAADGVLLNYLPASHVPECVARVRDGEADAGRDPGSCRVYAYVHVGVTERNDDTMGRAQRDIFGYAVTDGYGAMMRRAGYDEEISGLREAHARRDRKAAVGAISTRMVNDIDLVGSAEEVRSFVAAYQAAGVEEAVIMPLPWGPDRVAVIDATIRAVASMTEATDRAVASMTEATDRAVAEPQTGRP